MSSDRANHHTAIRFTERDYQAVNRLADYWGTTNADAIRTAIRIADALAKEIGYIPLEKIPK